MMGTFPQLLCVLGLALLCSWGFVVPDARAGEATDAMKSTIDEVLRIIQDQELKQPGKSEQRRKLLEKVVGERFDYQEMSLRTLSISEGVPWKNLSEKEREEFVGLF